MQNILPIPAIIAFTFGVLAAFPSAAQDSAPRPAAGAVMEQFAYYVRDKGVWKQMNDDHVAGDETPVMWVKRMRFEMAGDLMIDRTLAVYEDESCRPIATILHSAELNTGRFRTVAFVENGIQFSGVVSIIDDHTTERMAEGQVNADTRIRFREITDTSDPNQFTSRMFNPDGEGGWTYRDSASWTFDADLDICG